MNNTVRTTIVAATLALGFCASAFADACTVRVVNGASGKNDCIVAERVEDRSSFPVIAGRAVGSQNGVVVTTNGAVVLMPVAAPAPTMVHTSATVVAPRVAGPMHVTLSW